MLGGQRLDEVYANVMDRPYGALGDRSTDDTTAIQKAIDSGLHVLFPKGDYSLRAEVAGSETLNFNNDGQRCTFLAGAILRIESPQASMIITGKSQTFTGLNITTASGSVIPAQCVLIDRADGLLFRDVRVASTSTATAVRVRNTDRISIQSGRIVGADQTQLSVGLELGDGVRSLNAVGLALDQLGQGVVVLGATENISFTNSTIEANLVNMIEVQSGGSIRGLNLLGVHMEYGTGEIGCHQFIVVQIGASVEGGIIAGCEFGGTNPNVPDQRVFVVAGVWHGVTVAGCWHHGDDRAPAEHSVWEIRDTATITGSCDVFNFWDHVVIQTDGSGNEVNTLPMLQNTEGGTLTLLASAVRIRGTRIGFFGSAPVERPAAYTIATSLTDSGDHELGSANAAEVLATLLKDLAALGLIAIVAS